MGRKSVGGGAAGGKHASARSTVDEYRRQIGRYNTHHSKAKYRGRHSVRSSHSEHHKRNWKLIIFSIAVLFLVLGSFYAFFAVEVMETITRLYSK